MRTRTRTRLQLAPALVLCTAALAGCATDDGYEVATSDSRGTTETRAVPRPDVGEPASTSPSAPMTVALPPSIDFVLDNGMAVHLLPDDEVPLVYFGARVGGGGLLDAPSKEGTSALMTRLLPRGAGERDAVAFQETVDYVGGAFATSSGKRWIDVEAEFLSEHAVLGVELLADALRRPRLDAAEFEKARGLAIDGIRSARNQPNALIGSYWHAWLFQGHGYARPSGGDEDSLARVELSDVQRLAARQLDPRGTRLVVAGAFDPDAMRAHVTAAFADWAPTVRGETPVGHSVRAPRPQAADRARVLLVDEPDALQTYFHFGGPGIDWSHADYPARYLANTILGGRFTSRLNTALRIESGLSYGARSGFDDAAYGAFSVRTYTATATSQEAIELARDVYLRFAREGLTPEELESAVTYIKGQYAPDYVETADQAAGMLLDLHSDELPRDLVDGFFGRLDALTLADVNRVISEHFPTQALQWVVVGQADVLRPFVGTLGEVTEVKLAETGFGPGFRSPR